MPDKTNRPNDDPQPAIWREIEKVEGRLKDSIDGVDARVGALEMANQLQSFQNTLTKERLEELADGQSKMLDTLKADRQQDRREAEIRRKEYIDQVKSDAADHLGITNEILKRLDAVQYQNKADLFDKIRWIVTSVVITAIVSGIIAMIVTV